MRIGPCVGRAVWQHRRPFSSASTLRELRDAASLPDRIEPRYEESPPSSLLSLHWPQPPRNILIIPKLHVPRVTRSALVFAEHLARNYPDLNLVFEHRVAQAVHESLPFPIYTTDSSQTRTLFPDKIDLITTLGGDGTILRAASLFSLQPSVPPVLSFSMGTLGFLGEWKFEEHKRAWREVYMSGSGVAVDDLVAPHTQIAAGSVGDGGGSAATSSASSEENAEALAAWGSVRGQSLGVKRVSRMLLRNRLKVGVYDQAGVNINDKLTSIPATTTTFSSPTQQAKQVGPPCPPRSPVAANTPPPAFHAINELLIHRGPHTHLAIIDIYINDHFLTEAVADGILVSTPTGSTAYSLSAGGAIIHPLVGSLLITPICPRSLSFRPLVLPLNTKVSLRLSERNRGRDLEVSIDGKRKAGVGIGMEVRVEGEAVGRTADGSWRGGVPCVIRAPRHGARGVLMEDDDGWVGGLNSLLKFNYPFGETPAD
ncbi:mitochondrial NADH kinase [Grosmannia clavigera kw1407]|uniref:Mitochondrial NADH kinase n=1 Tax=Grosmannia clavigera (strain kw1407 / UAMH 11150) TaxID=655863 RepID=F0XP30_GROCL|nr:mitochondrial NADH kinase [Grosmannia clavigera kw1407]EFX00075.1 mitochondrial NADH kinase [Grosmannia clavigera kw1407]